ncbi:unnamed protein product [Darwinula stevensoni]|uniref:V-SNARE coiled-coil homology domain-containing protein n=1 Tax=Darwinula stevensoni TaxID=69355 RepID=A0A7R9ADY2_9CRUS|nr:unnamed protein product [Darwinula stevensoni]CAG0901493.1 unnamed protein product [Darwinula stevensoni]
MSYSDALQQGASQFEQSAGKLKRKYWWKNLKMWLILIAIVLVIIIIIIIVAVNKSGGDGDKNGTSGKAPPLSDGTHQGPA